MKVDHIVPFIGEEASGPTYSVPQLCESLEKYVSTVTLHVLGPVPKNDFNFNISSYYRCKLPHSRWLKKAVWAFSQGDVLRNSACLHATAELEYREIRRKGLRAPVAIIPNGIEIPPERKQKKNF